MKYENYEINKEHLYSGFLIANKSEEVIGYRAYKNGDFLGLYSNGDIYYVFEETLTKH